ncbi:helix-turn-helix domain-containing protein [Micromonospora sp. NPDC049559]|uniref:helix-turn-helix domain-containing protein n=1 Tax=Micromonospora sp. NPDC049559 TaxID=3155923 RepID=UPI003415039A
MADPLADEVRRLRTVERLSARQIQARLGIGKGRLYELLRGVPPPEWTRRPNAKDGLRARAVELRGEGWSVNEIAGELGVAKSTVYQWVRQLPPGTDADQAAKRRARSKAMNEARWAEHRIDRERARAEVHERAVDRIGPIDDRDLLLLGAAIFWCEGTKSRPWRRDDRLQLINSDVRLLALFLRFLESCGVERTVPSYRVSIP